MNAITQILSFKSKLKRDVYEAVVTGKGATAVGYLAHTTLQIVHRSTSVSDLGEPYVNEPCRLQLLLNIVYYS
jgi:hypothetical protein